MFLDMFLMMGNNMDINIKLINNNTKKEIFEGTIDAYIQRVFYIKYELLSWDIVDNVLVIYVFEEDEQDFIRLL